MTSKGDTFFFCKKADGSESTSSHSLYCFTCKSLILDWEVSEVCGALQTAKDTRMHMHMHTHTGLGLGWNGRSVIGEKKEPCCKITRCGKEILLRLALTTRELRAVQSLHVASLPSRTPSRHEHGGANGRGAFASLYLWFLPPLD